eukprot:XP_001610014.1 SNF2 domain-containing protein / helicase domain-containing protein [Babesia bovis T2Bo]
MALELHGIKEIDSRVIEEKASSGVEEVIKLQNAAKCLQAKLESLDPNGENAKIFKNVANKIREIVRRIIEYALCGDEVSFEDDETLEYEFIEDTKLRVGTDIVDISEEHKENTEVESLDEFSAVTVDRKQAYKLIEDVFCPADVFEKLYTHQKKGVKWLAEIYRNRHGGILADEMGLGKTVTVLSFLNSLIFSAEAKTLNITELKVLIVCPITLISQWKNEMIKWCPELKPLIFHTALGSFKKHFIREMCQYTALITSYETLRLYIDSVCMINWSYVVLDEGQKIRNPDASITLAVKTLGTPYRLLLSGSPIQNNLVEFWSLLDFVAPGHLGTLPIFIEHFVNPIVKCSNNSNSSLGYNCALRLREIVRPFIRRHVKSEFAELLKLPRKSEQVIMCNLSPAQYEMYMALLKTGSNVANDGMESLPSLQYNKREYSKKFNSNRFLMLLTLLRKTCNHPDLVLQERPEDYGDISRSTKLKVAMDIIEKWEANGDKVLIFTQTIQMLDIIHDTLAKHYGQCRMARIDGEVSIKKRAKLLESFHSDENMFLLLLTTRVGGVGLNLTCANRVLIFDPDWNPMTDSQARERSYRIGQNRDVVIYRLISAHTVEEKIYHRQIYKFYMSEKILSDPSVIGFRYLPASDLLRPPPRPPGVNNNDAYMDKIQKQMDSIDFEMDIRMATNTKDVYQRTSDARKGIDESDVLSSIFSHDDVQGVIKHDDIEKTVSCSMESNTTAIVDNAIKLLQKSLKERNAYDISVPTWTGTNGQAAAPVTYKPNRNRSGLKVAKRPNHHNESHMKQKDAMYIVKMIIDFFRYSPNKKAVTGDVSGQRIL